MNYQIINHIFSDLLLSCPILFEIFTIIGILVSMWVAMKVLKVVWRVLGSIGKCISDNCKVFLFIVIVLAIIGGFTTLCVYSNIISQRPETGCAVIFTGGSVGRIVSISDDSYDENTKYTIEYIKTIHTNDGETVRVKKEICKEDFTRDQFEIRKKK